MIYHRLRIPTYILHEIIINKSTFYSSSDACIIFFQVFIAKLLFKILLRYVIRYKYCKNNNVLYYIIIIRSTTAEQNNTPSFRPTNDRPLSSLISHIDIIYFHIMYIIYFTWMNLGPDNFDLIRYNIRNNV